MSENKKHPKDVEDQVRLQFNELMFKFTAIQKKLVFVVDGVEFRANDIHLIDTIGRHPQANVTELARYLGITKGAVSQKLKSLEDKGFILRRKDPSNAKEVLVELTEFGVYAYEKHEEYHDGRDSDIIDFLRNASIDNLKFLVQGLGIINGMMDSYLNETCSLCHLDLSDHKHKIDIAVKESDENLE